MEASWRIISEYTDKVRTMVIVVCSCGSSEVRRKDHVISGRTKSCKRCASKKTATKFPPPINYKGTGDLSATFWLHIKNGAKKRGIPFDITIDQAWNLFLDQKKKCALSGQLLTMVRESLNSNVDWSRTSASLDRKDSTLGYTIDNIQWVHKTVNYIKRDLSQEEFIIWCKLIGTQCGS